MENIQKQLIIEFDKALSQLPENNPFRRQAETVGGYTSVQNLILSFALKNKIGIPAAFSQLQIEFEYV